MLRHPQDGDDHPDCNDDDPSLDDQANPAFQHTRSVQVRTRTPWNSWRRAEPRPQSEVALSCRWPSTTFPLPHGSGTSCKSLDARKRHAPLGRRNWLGGIPKAVIPSPLAHAIGAGVWVATVASVALLANAATYFYLEYRLWNAWTPGVIAT